MKSLLKTAVVSILTWEAKYLLSRTKPTIIAITGSVGKTSTKDAVFQVIRQKIPTRKSEKSYNSEIGVPLSILGLENAWQNPLRWLKNIIDGLILALFPGDYPKVLVLETGVDRPGDMKRLTEWLHPDIVILTCLPTVPVHVEHFNSPQEVIAEKLVLVEALRPDGILVYNNDDEITSEVARSVRQRTVGYGRYSPSDFFATKDDVLYENGTPVGIRFNVCHADQEVNFTIMGTLGAQNSQVFAAASAVASLFEITLSECADAATSYSPPPGRMRIIKGLKETTIIDDSYNSSPTAMARALTTLNELRGTNRKIAVIGDMLELGRHSVEEHRKIGEQAAKMSDVLFTVGVRARGVAQAALAAGMKEKNILQYEESLNAARELQNLIKPGDVVLVKGSQSMRMERVVEEIMAEPDQAEELLVRQDKMWHSLR